MMFLAYFLLIFPFVAGTSQLEGNFQIEKQKEILPQKERLIKNQDIKTIWNKKSTSHHKSYQQFQSRPFRSHLDINPCRFKRCYLGQKCVVDGITGRGVCVCKQHCRTVSKPLCGTDGEYYTNRCEMHKKSCIDGKDVYDARNKNCFYKRSSCDSEDVKSFKLFLFQFFQTSTTAARLDKVSIADNKVLNENTDQSKKILGLGKFGEKNNTPSFEEDFFVKTDLDFNKLNGSESKNELYPDVITNDVKGNGIKSLFRFLDLDENGLVGSEEAHEVTLMENLDLVIPPPCSLFHLLHFSDFNGDNLMSVQEIMKLYNITLLQLPTTKKLVRRKAVTNSEVTISCDIEGESKPTWKHKELNIEIFSDFIKVKNTSLVISRIHPSLAGDYTCHARFRPDLYQTIELSVVVKPRVEVYPKVLQSATGSSATMMCWVDGSSPSITWSADGKDLHGERYIFLEKNTELHINSVVNSDRGNFKCRATNSAGTSEENVVMVVNENIDNASSQMKGVYLIFHAKGIIVMETKSCREIRRIEPEEAVPGLLRQSKLCRSLPSVGVRNCVWSQAVAIKPRLVYAAQPTENRVLVFDTRLMRIVEVITTDPIPASLHYSKSTDQLFVLCWNDNTRTRSTLLAVHAASEPGPHVAAQIQSLDNGNTVDFSVHHFFVPAENTMNPASHKGFVFHNQQSSLRKLNLTSLLYDDSIIDLQPYNCSSVDFNFRPIGGTLDINCENRASGSKRRLAVNAPSWHIAIDPDASYDREFVSAEGLYVVRTRMSRNNISVYFVNEAGKLNLIMSLNKDFEVSDVAFVKLPDSRGVIVFLTSFNTDYVLRLDSYTQRTEMIKNVFQSRSPPFPKEQFRRLIASPWYEGQISTFDGDQFKTMNIYSNDVACHINNVAEIAAVVSIETL